MKGYPGQFQEILDAEHGQASTRKVVSEQYAKWLFKATMVEGMLEAAHMCFTL